MPISQPSNFRQAIEYMARKRILPTHLGTEEIRQWSQAEREQAFFSARNFYDQVLEAEKAAVEGMK